MAEQKPQVPPDMKEFNRKVIEEYRANNGRLTGPAAKMNPLLLTTKGRKTGAERTVVLGYRPAGHAMVVIASNNGSDQDPDWYRNLLEDPHGTVEVNGRKFDVRARTAEGEERDRMGALVDYLERQQALTHRRIPLVILEPIP